MPIDAGMWRPSRSNVGDAHARSRNPDPLPPSPAIRPSIATIAPDSGSIHGGAWSTITGTDFQPGATVQLGQQKAKQIVVKSTTVVVFWTEARAAGVVDVTVTNPGGLTATLPGSYTYAAPASFDPDGEWIAHAGPDFDIEMHLTFTFGRLVDVTCGAHRVVLSSPSTLENGEFASGNDDGMALAGRLVSPVNAVGTLTFDGCASGQWWAEKAGSVTRAIVEPGQARIAAVRSSRDLLSSHSAHLIDRRSASRSTLPPFRNALVSRRGTGIDTTGFWRRCEASHERAMAPIGQHFRTDKVRVLVREAPLVRQRTRCSATSPTSTGWRRNPAGTGMTNGSRAREDNRRLTNQ